MKIAVAAAVSIALAGRFGLKYPATAGIITVLSIGNTKRETLKTAAKRGAAFLCALLFSAGCFQLLGYTLQGFALYLTLFALLCLCAGWGEAIAMDSVLVTHFLAEGSMGRLVLRNEILLFLIGTLAGIAVNLHLRRREEDFEKLSEEVDDQIKGILHRMSLWLPKEDRRGYGSGCFERLEKALVAARDCAAANYNNAVFTNDNRELEYVEMREKQGSVLREIYGNIKSIAFLPEQAEQVAALFGEVERSYHRDNTVDGLLGKMEELLADLKGQELPASREEFEARAVLFHILMQVRRFLELKKDYVQKRQKTKNVNKKGAKESS